jgi:hypothetical protein
MATAQGFARAKGVIKNRFIAKANEAAFFVAAQRAALASGP